MRRTRFRLRCVLGGCWLSRRIGRRSRRSCRSGRWRWCWCWRGCQIITGWNRCFEYGGNRRCRRWGGCRRGRSRSRGRGRRCRSRCWLGLSFVGDDKRCVRHRCHRYRRRAGDDHLVDRFKRIGRTRRSADESSCQNVPRLTSGGHRYHATLASAFLGEIENSQKMELGHIHCQSRTGCRDDRTFEFAGDQGRGNGAQAGDQE